MFRLDWAQELVNDDFVQVAEKTDIGRWLVDRIPAQGWIKCAEGRTLG